MCRTRSDRPLLISLLGAVLVLCPAALADDDEQIVDPEKLKLEERQRLENEARALRSLGEMDIEQVMQVRIEDEQLLVQTTLTQTAGQVKVQIRQLPGFTTLNVQGKPQEGLGAPQYFQLLHHNFNTPGAISIHTSVFSRPDYLQIAQDSQLFGEDRTVSLIYAPNLAGVAEEAVRVNVQRINNISGAVVLELKLSASSFAELRRLYPRETAEYLQPIFRDLGQEGAVFAIDPRLAWQVFAEAYVSDAKLAAHLRRLVEQFDSDSFEKREAALEELRGLGQPAALELMRFDRRGLSAEQLSRIDTFLAPYRPIDATAAARLRDDTDFLLDCLYGSPDPVRRLALARLRKKFERDLEFDLALEGAERYTAVSRLRAELNPRFAPEPASTQPEY